MIPDIKELEKLPEIEIDYNIDNLIVLRRRAVPKFPSGYIEYEDYVSGNIGFIDATEIVFQFNRNYTFEIYFFGKNKNSGLKREYYYLVKKNSWYKYKIYFISFLRDLNMRILYTLQIWDLLEREIGRNPDWSDLKIYKWLKNVRSK